LLALALAGCARRPPPPPPPPPPDADATPEASRLLPFDAPQADSLDRAAGDLDDWYRIEVAVPGTVRLVLGARAAGSLANMTLALTDSSGAARVQPLRSGGRERVEVEREVAPGTWFVWVGSEPDARQTGAVAYELRASFLPKPAPKPRVRRKPPPPPAPVAPPPPPAPRFDTVETTLVEVERPRDDGQFATIVGGAGMGFRPGLRGRLLDGDRVLASFEIVEVYAGGSRVKIHGRLSGPVSGRTAVQVEVPRGP
jgi:hypothetical protein